MYEISIAYMIERSRLCFTPMQLQIPTNQGGIWRKEGIEEDEIGEKGERGRRNWREKEETRKMMTTMSFKR